MCVILTIGAWEIYLTSRFVGLVLQVIIALHTSYSTLSRDYAMELKSYEPKFYFLGILTSLSVNVYTKKIQVGYSMV